MNDARRVRWRIDATTSRTVRALWALGAGTLLAAIVLVVFARLLALTDGVGGEPILVGTLAVLVVTILVLAVVGGPGERIAALRRRLPGTATTTAGNAGSDGSNDTDPDRAGEGAETTRAMDAAVGAIVGGAVIYGLARGVGGGVGHGAAALTLPIALAVLVASSFVQSAGAIDPDERRIELAEPEGTIDLEVIRGVSVREFGDLAMLSLDYRQPGGQYVPGPRRLVVPPEVASEAEALLESSH